MDRNVIILIPARYNSTRFPGKPLVNINGQTMINRVYGRCKDFHDEVYVATDDEKIKNHVQSFGGKVIMTSGDHLNGTSRCLEAAQTLSAKGKSIDIVINVQGDEPFIHKDHITSLINCFDDDRVSYASIYTTIKNDNQSLSPVYVVIDHNSDALYFSRSPIPFILNQQNFNTKIGLKKHIGTYGYTLAALHKYVNMTPTPLEKEEKLEQLRWLENGEKIRMIESQYDSFCIDTPEDLERLLNSNLIYKI